MKTKRQRYERYTEEILREAVAGSRTISDVLRHLGHTRINGNIHAHVAKRIRGFAIDTSHFDMAHVYANLKRSEPRTAEQILVRSTSGNRVAGRYLRRSLIEIGRELRCGVCGLYTWNGKPITLQVEHRDGDWQNNEPDNLLFICPNCHSQTETYCIKNSEKYRIMVAREKEKKRLRQGKARIYHERPKARKTQRPPREILEHLIESQSMVAIGKKFGVSDNSVRKWAKIYGLEILGRGELAKRRRTPLKTER